MPVYIAMLRGINVGGNKVVKMDALCKSLEALGFEEVKTYLQSGNAVFKATKQSPAELCKKIEKRILRDFGFGVTVISRSTEEMGRMIEQNPFMRDKGVDTSKLHVTFLDSLPEPSAWKKMAAVSAGSDRFHPAGSDIYLHCPGGYGNTKLSNNAFERILAVRATTRNWNTVNNLYQMAAGDK